MAAQVVAAGELIEYLTGIVDKHGDIPVTINSATSSATESIGHPVALPVVPAGEAGGFHAYDHGRPEDTPQTKAAPIN